MSKICSCMHKNNFRFQTFSDNLFAQKLFPPVSSLVCVIWSNNYDYSLLHTSSFSCQSQDVHSTVCLSVASSVSTPASVDPLVSSGSSSGSQGGRGRGRRGRGRGKRASTPRKGRVVKSGLKSQGRFYMLQKKLVVLTTVWLP